MLLPGVSRLRGYWDKNSILRSEQIDGSFKLWYANSGKELPTPPWESSNISVLGDGNVALALEEKPDRVFSIWDVKTSAKLLTLTDPTKSARFCISADGTRLAVATTTGVRIRDFPSGKETAFIPNSTNPVVSSVEFSPDGSRLLIWEGEVTDALLDGRSYLWDISVTQPRQIGKNEGSLFRFSPDGKFIIFNTRNDNSSFELWDANLSEKTVVAKSAKSAVDFSPDGKMLAYSAPLPSSLPVIRQYLPRLFPENEIKIMNPHTRTEIASIPGEKFVWFPDSRSLATYRADGVVQIWDLPLRRPLLVDYGLPVLFVLLAGLAGRDWFWMRRERMR